MMEPLLVSVSGGRSSGIMARMIQSSSAFDAYERFYLFANTGKEREETLVFIKRLTEHWGLPIVWLEAVVVPGKGNATKHREVTFETAARKGEPFDAVIAKYGVPNKFFSHCTRELKLQAMASYMRERGYSTWTSAIGMRLQERNRMSGRTPYGPAIYPLANRKLTRQEVRLWWREQPFDLEIEDYQGNCDLCFKKSLAKRLQILKEEPERADWWAAHEDGDEYKFDMRAGLTVLEQLEMARGAAVPRNVDVQLEFPCICGDQ